MTRIVVLGASGMLGAMVFDWLARDNSLEVAGTVRQAGDVETLKARYPHAIVSLLDAEGASDEELTNAVHNAEWIINAIGVIKPYIRDNNATEVERATLVNSVFPHRLARATATTGSRVIQIATDCVYSGQKGQYVESDSHDPLDVYGKTKSLGEVHAPHVFHLRCSIIGPEPRAHRSLLDWFLGQPRNAQVNGFTNHQWNGVTTLHFAKLCQALIKDAPAVGHVQHIVPAGSISKSDLLNCFARNYRRDDIAITPIEAGVVVDRTLATTETELNAKLWRVAGYSQLPTVAQMVTELAHFDFSFQDKAK